LVEGGHGSRRLPFRVACGSICLAGAGGETIQWGIQNNVVCGHDLVFIYAVDPTGGKYE
jgi:hypothetical protein